MAIVELTIFYLLITETTETIFKNYNKFYEVTAFNFHERSILYSLQMNNDSVVFLNGVTNEAAIPMHVIVDKCCVKQFEQQLQYEGIEYVMHDDLFTRGGQYYQGQNKSLVGNTTKSYSMSDGFLKWEDIGMWINRQQKLNPLLEKIVISNTYEKRELFILSIAKWKENPAVVIVGGEQGKDWMSSAIILKIINDLQNNKDFIVLMEYYNFYFLPILNPDGYAFSMAKDRFWDKNRKAFFPKKKCYSEYYLNKDIAVGVNIDRNWYFGTSLGFGDGSECDSIYMGHKPLCEEEPKALSEFLNSHATSLMAFFNLKGFGGRLITLPYCDTTMQSYNHGVLMEIIMSACEKVHQKYNSTYYHGSTGRFFYNVSGNSADWIKKHFNVPIVSTIHVQYKEENFPQSAHIGYLTQEFITIINEILLISKEIYGPLFNHQTRHTKNTYTYLALMVGVHKLINKIFMQ